MSNIKNIAERVCNKNVESTPPVFIIEENQFPQKPTHCDLPYSRFSVKMNPIDCCKKINIPGTTSLPKLC